MTIFTRHFVKILGTDRTMEDSVVYLPEKKSVGYYCKPLKHENYDNNRSKKFTELNKIMPEGWSKAKDNRLCMYAESKGDLFSAIFLAMDYSKKYLDAAKALNKGPDDSGVIKAFSDAVKGMKIEKYYIECLDAAKALNKGPDDSGVIKAFSDKFAGMDESEVTQYLEELGFYESRAKHSFGPDYEIPERVKLLI